MNTREKVINCVKQLLIGPDPLPGYTQDNGEEILFFDSPLRTYISGILFPQVLFTNENESEIINESEVYEVCAEGDTLQSNNVKEKFIKSNNIAEPTNDLETSKINNYHQSGMGITLCNPYSSEYIDIKISVGSYTEDSRKIPVERIDENQKKIIEWSDKEKTVYLRHQVYSTLRVEKKNLPTTSNRHRIYELYDENNSKIEGLAITITYRMSDEVQNYNIYTITLLNTNKGSKKVNVSDCWFQVSFSVSNLVGFASLPENFCADINDSDYKLNALLYKDVKTYAIGHGCAAAWDDRIKEAPKTIRAETLPEYDVKPIVPTISNASLSMKTYYSTQTETFNDLQILCNEYESWISNEEAKINLLEEHHKETARHQIELCKRCLVRMHSGITLLKEDPLVLEAFQLANKAMLMQQLHYKMPLTKFKEYDLKTYSLIPEKEIILPDVDNDSTWTGDKKYYGKWRPFQIAFILMNIKSMTDPKSSERDIVDLIWFPTGGGKTEAYLGLTAFTILLRRLKNPADSGTTVIMRYTLRLLTSQQYERASSLICSLESLRKENPQKLGTERITIGLWVGSSLTENKNSEVIKRIKDIENGKIKENVSVVLKCPWCGAQMETFYMQKSAITPGYYYSKKIGKVIFKCGNKSCDFSDEKNPLPLNLFDDDIYENPPTLLFGTVDKFAMLPYRPEAKSLFGGDREHTPPELIIQDELHLITGPLGSTVGLYETLINQLCIDNGQKPKIIAATATISHAKQQCNALYNCKEENVFQFPVQGISYRDCFFAKEDAESIGRKYIGLYGSAASSSATASIYTFAAFLYAAKAIEVTTESERDPYWTNLSYFGSMRELGQAATWYIADIKERLEIIYNNHLQTRDKEKRRYIYESGLAELTSRMNNVEIPKILKNLEVKYDNQNSHPIDVCLATNMVSVGVDVPRLGLMTVTGQPKSMSEYIQATSRVGRDAKNAPGIVLIIYNTAKPRDKSHYEKFQAQHSKLYFNVEPTSVTPFSRPLRERALQAIFVGLYRFMVEKTERNNARHVPSKDEFLKIQKIIVDRAEEIDKGEVEDIKDQLYNLWQEWDAWRPEVYSSFALESTAPLIYPSGVLKPEEWGERGWPTPTSMRNVDRECGLDCSKLLTFEEEEMQDNE